LADHLVEIDDLAVVSEDVPSIEVHVFPADRTDLLDAAALKASVREGDYSSM
jgi:hypothetical protein